MICQGSEPHPPIPTATHAPPGEHASQISGTTRRLSTVLTIVALAGNVSAASTPSPAAEIQHHTTESAPAVEKLAATPKKDEPRRPSELPSILTRDEGWSAGTIAAQLDIDPTDVPFGKGAIFVPAMTNPLDEPPVAVWRGERKVAEGTTGQRIVVLPGTYQVRLGSGALEHRLNVQAVVRELHTSVIPVSWSGLAIHVVDERLNSLRGSYEIIRVLDREYVGIGFGADEQAGEPVTTWILRPGLYKIVRVGETYRARRDFATVRLEGGKLTHFQLVVDPETDAFQGGGEVPQEDLFLAQSGELWANLIFGGDLAVNSRRNTVGTEPGESYAFRVFADTKVSGQILGSPLIVQLQIEEGRTKAPDLPWQKTQDRADLDALYVYKLFPWLGPYARLGAETNFLEGHEYYDSPRTVVIRREDGSLKRRIDVEQQRLSPSFGLTSIKEGAGLHARAHKSLTGETTFRLGVGARHLLTNGLLESASNTPGVTYEEVPSSQQVGVEGTMVAVARLTRWLLFNVEVDALLPFESLQDVVVEIEATMALKLTSFASINYAVRFLRNRSLSTDDPLEQDVLLRFSIELP